jgi:hypothetical protein
MRSTSHGAAANGNTKAMSAVGNDPDDQTRNQAPEPANVSIVRRFYHEIWNNWRVEVADEIVSPVVRFRGSLGTAISGRDAKAHVEGVRTAFPDWHNQIDELLAVEIASSRGSRGQAPTKASSPASRPRGSGFATSARRSSGSLPARSMRRGSLATHRSCGARLDYFTTSIGAAVRVDNAQRIRACD